MHCIVLSSSTGEANWRIHRSVEVLAYHRQQELVRALVWLVAENLSNHDEYLRMLHRGNVVCKPDKAWPPPRHSDEPVEQSSPGALQALYGEGFDSSSAGDIQWIKELTPWDSWLEFATPPAICAPANLDATVESALADLPDSKPSVNGEYRPFTVWNVGPFPARQTSLVAFHLEFGGATYSKLVGTNSLFTIDGPRRLLSRIMNYDLLSVQDRTRRQAYQNQIGKFLDPATRLSADGYDVVILRPAVSDGVEVLENECRNGIYAAPRQAPAIAHRFLTTNQSFTITLRYSFDNKGEQPVTPERFTETGSAI